MSESQYAPTPEDVEFLSRLRRYTREHPERFLRGAQGLVEAFSLEAVYARRAREHDEARREHLRRYPEGIEHEGEYETRARVASEQSIRLGERLLRELNVWHGLDLALEWAQGFPYAVDSAIETEAEAVVLLAAIGYDEDASTNDAIADKFRTELKGVGYMFARRGTFAKFLREHIDRVREAWSMVTGEPQLHVHPRSSEPVIASTPIQSRIATDRIATEQEKAPAPHTLVETERVTTSPAASNSEAVPASASSDDTYVTLDQAAAIAGLSKRTLEKHLRRGSLPRPDIQGGRGRASTWQWAKVRSALEPLARKPLPSRFPSGRILPLD
jgi:hypothetical protein